MEDSFRVGLNEWKASEHHCVHVYAFSTMSCSLAFLSSEVLFLAICRAVFIHLVLFVRLVLRPLSLFGDSADFNYSEGSFFLFFLGRE